MTPNGFAGSVFDLDPATMYEARFVLSDPDGVDGRTERVVSVRTRAEPMPATGGKVYHVYPPSYKGQRQQPAFTGLLAAYYTGSSHSDNFNTYPPRVQPGDTILVHAGVYKDDRLRYGGGLGHGVERHLLPHAERDGRSADRDQGAPAMARSIFDGDGAYNLFNVMAANYNYFEGLTIRNTDLRVSGRA